MTSPQGLSDAEIEERLRAAPAETWARLADALAALEALPAAGSWVPSEPRGTMVVDGAERDVWSMPYVVRAPELDGLLAAVAALGASEPFDWITWSGIERYPRGDGLDRAPVGESVRMVTAAARADRFSEGALLDAVENGTLGAAVSRLVRWHAQDR